MEELLLVFLVEGLELETAEEPLLVFLVEDRGARDPRRSHCWCFLLRVVELEIQGAALFSSLWVVELEICGGAVVGVCG